MTLALRWNCPSTCSLKRGMFSIRVDAKRRMDLWNGLVCCPNVILHGLRGIVSSGNITLDIKIPTFLRIGMKIPVWPLGSSISGEKGGRVKEISVPTRCVPWTCSRSLGTLELRGKNVTVNWRNFRRNTDTAWCQVTKKGTECYMSGAAIKSNSTGNIA